MGYILSLAMFAIVFVSVLALTSGAPRTAHKQPQAAERCCVPKQWEGNLGVTDTKYEMGSDKGQAYLSGGNVSYDATNEMVQLSVGTINQDGEALLWKAILDFKNDKTYFMTPEEGCRFYPIGGPFREACVPDTFQPVRSTYLGAGKGNYLNIDIWQGPWEDYGIQTSMVTSTGCVPVGESRIGNLPNENDLGNAAQVQSLGYSNISAGIKDRGVFVPPAGCVAGEFKPPKSLA